MPDTRSLLYSLLLLFLSICLLPTLLLAQNPYIVLTGTALRQKLDAIHPEAIAMILDRLSVVAQRDTSFEQTDLVKIWPKYNEKR